MNDIVVVKVDKARQLLAEVRTASEAKHVADLAHAAEVYAKRQKASEEVIAHAHAIKIDAMTRMGELLKEMQKNEGGRPPKTPTVVEGVSVPSLDDVGISWKDSSSAQALATIKEQLPELHEEVRKGKRTVSQARMEVKRQKRREHLKAKAEVVPESSDWRIVLGDCLEETIKIPPGTVRLCFMDPPYNVGVDYGNGPEADLLDDNDYLRWFEITTIQIQHRLTPDGSLWVLINDEYAADFVNLFKSQGLTLRNWIKWYETFGVNCVSKFNRCSRHLLYFVKDPKHYVFNADAVNRPSDRQAKYNDARASPGGKVWDDVWQIPRLTGTCKERIPDFPTQLPLDLLRPIVGCASDPGDLVLDPFSGSATTGVAALESGRRYLGIEKSSTFHRLASLRLKGVRHDSHG